MNKKLYYLISILEVLLIAAVYPMQRLCIKKLGFLRWVNYYNNKWNKNSAVRMALMIAFLSAAILMVIAVFLYVKRHKDCNRIKILDVLICVFLTIGAFLFVIIFDTGTITVKYFGAIFYVTAAFLQNIKTICSLKVKK